MKQGNLHNEEVHFDYIVYYSRSQPVSEIIPALMTEFRTTSVAFG